MIKKTFFAFLFLGAITMIIMSIHYFQYRITGILKGKEVASQLWYLCVLRLHIFCGLIAISIGPFQFIKTLRKRNPGVHRKIGFIYFISILFGGVAGLIVAQFAMGGLVSRLGFSALSVVWMGVTIAGLLAVIRGDIKRHRLFMILSYAMTFTAIPQRTFLSLTLFTDLTFLDVYRLSAWIPWILNLIIGYLIYYSSSIKRIHGRSLKMLVEKEIRSLKIVLSRFIKASWRNLWSFKRWV